MNETNPLSIFRISDYLDRYQDLFRVHRRDNRDKAERYLEGIFHNCKSNIERMDEMTASSEYQSLHHFISESPWDHELVLSAVRKDISDLFLSDSSPVGLLFDESGHRKSGKKSVGVSRQYLGSIGKTDNGQVAVFGALNQGNRTAMVDTRLFLPKSWTDDRKRCKKAGIPKDSMDYKTKPELVLDMVRDMGCDIEYDWIGGDSIYGNSKILRSGLTELERLFVMDASENLSLYTENPEPYIPETGKKGRPKTSYISDKKPILAKDLASSLCDDAWKTYKFRKGTKGWMERQVVTYDVFLWSHKRVTKKESEKLRLIISRNIDGSEVKYSLCNDVSIPEQKKLTDSELLYMQMQRYWVERGFQECKDSLGMTDYQVRKWRAWHHHMTLTIMALHYILMQKIRNGKDIPLLSCPDIKMFFALTIMRKANTPDEIWDIIRKRHHLRQKDIDRYK